MKNSKGIFEKVAGMLHKLKFNIIDEDRNRPWGGFYVIDEKQALPFAACFFPEQKLQAIAITAKLSPKILMVSPGKRLSWQYHHRRAEIWRCIEGSVAVVTSNSDVETDRKILSPGDQIQLKQGERHRLIGLDGCGVVAEIWQHTDILNPSNEEDIVRLQDDFGR